MPPSDGPIYDSEATALSSSPPAEVGSIAELRPGDMLESYEILCVIGVGGMGVVYSAYDTKLERQVAIKVVRPKKSANDEEATARMLREAQAMAKLSHPNVAAVYQVGTIGRSIFIVMEYIAGGTLTQWLLSSPRPWRAIVEMLVAAGRGLEAAHRAGIIHRDFKPDNVLIGRDGRVRVTDFGLAREQRPRDDDDGEDADDNTTTPVQRRSTPHGLVMGTPPYMPAEALMGKDADAQVDQYAFCVTLFEALCGTRPFTGSSRGELIDNIFAGRMNPVPAHVEVPRWLRQLVLRGLSREASARYASMTALLHELDRRPISRLNIAIAATAAVALALGAVALARGGASEPAPCLHAADKLADVWNPVIRDRIATAFDASKLPYAATARDSVLTSLDQYGSEWIRMNRDSCEATRVRGEQSEQLLDRRTLCLDRRRSELAAFTDVLAKATPEVIQSAVVASRRLSAIEDCSATNQAHADTPSPETRVALDRLGAEVARTKVLFDSGSFEQSVTAARGAIEQARGVGLRQIEAEALLIAGKAEHQRGHLDQSEEMLVQAVAAAKASHQEEIETEAYTELVYLVGYDKAKPGESTVWARLAEIGTSRGIGGNALEARLLNSRGAALFGQGRPADALVFITRARELRQRLYPQGHPDLAESIDNTGSIYQAMGQPEKALVEHTAAVAMFEKLLGADHPATADAVNNLANDFVNTDRRDEAEKLYRRALDTYTRALGPTHANVAVGLTNLGMLAMAQNDYPGALAHFHRALEIEQTAFGQSHPKVAETLANIGRAELASRHPVQAAQALRDALAIWGKLDHVQPAAEAARFVLARTMWQLRDRRRALATAVQARDRLRTAGSPWTSVAEEIDGWLAKPE